MLEHLQEQISHLFHLDLAHLTLFQTHHLLLLPLHPGWLPKHQLNPHLTLQLLALRPHLL